MAAAAACALVAVAIVAPSMTGPLAGTLAPIAPILGGGALVFAVGLLDDLRPLPPWPKLAVQIAAAVLVMRSGLLIARITLGGETFQLGVWAWPVTLVWIVGLTNAFNLIDGVDGLAAGVSGDCGCNVRRDSHRARPCSRSDAAGGAGRRRAGLPRLQLRAGVDFPR